MGEERAEDHIGDENQQLVVDTTHQLIPEIDNRFVKSRILSERESAGNSAHYRKAKR